MLPIVSFKRRMPVYNSPVCNSYCNQNSYSGNAEINIKEDADQFLIEIAAPGYVKENFVINVENDTLLVEAKTGNDEKSVSDNYLRKEFGVKSFRRYFGLPDTVDKSLIEASYENGILSIKIPKKEELKPKPAKEIKVV